MIDALLTDMNIASQSYFQALAGSDSYGYGMGGAGLNGYGTGTGSIGGSSFSDYLRRISEANSEESRRILDYDRVNYRDERTALQSSPPDSETEKSETSGGNYTEGSTEKTASETSDRTPGLEQPDQKASRTQADGTSEKVVDGKEQEGKSGKAGGSDFEDKGINTSSAPGNSKNTGSKLVQREGAPSAETVGNSEKTGKGKTARSLKESLTGSLNGQGKSTPEGDRDPSGSKELKEKVSSLPGKVSGITARKKDIGNGEDGENIVSRIAAESGQTAIQATGTVMKEAEKTVAGSHSDRKSDSEKVSLEAGKAAPKKADGSVIAKETADSPKLTIVDARNHKTAKDRHNDNADQAKNSGRSEGRPAASVFQGKVDGAAFHTTNRQNDSSLQVMQVHLGADSPHGTATSEPRAAVQGDLQNQLAQQLKEQLNGEIVKRSSILMRNNGSGEIRLELKPEQLGNVKIRISLENNNIAGKILVENNSVKEAFDQNLQQLYRAFREHGFGDASLNVSVGDHRQRQQQDARTAVVHSGYRENLAVSIENGAGSVLRTGDELRLVDMLA